MIEYGVFNDEGMIDRGFYRLADAQRRMTELERQGETDLQALELCPEHADSEQPARGCEVCHAEDA